MEVLSILSDPTEALAFEISITIIDKTEMRLINNKYRNVDAPTDVLSFAMREGEFGDIHPELLGDLLLCPDVIMENAEADGRSFEDEMIFITVHGILHLFGYDHLNSEEEKAKMQNESNRVLTALNDGSFCKSVNYDDLAKNPPDLVL